MKLSWVWVLAGVIILSGCGQKGPLYLPEAADQTENQ
ncbi:LPS translocon maturation chaperone LptM [Neptunomonas antarctica]|nr:lipoprotein [Neptunomonas antarctica]